jgi:N-acetylmuramoyl-L-alanine amidase
MPDPAPISVDTPNVLDLRFILVTVRTDFLFKKDGKIAFHWLGGEAISGATVELLAAKGSAPFDTAVTDSNGQATLETSQLPNGNYTVKITPKNSRNFLAGPDIAETDPAPLPNRMYHPLEVAVRLLAGMIDSATIDAAVKYAGLGNRTQQKWPPDALPADHLPIDLKPIWMRGFRAATARTRATGDIQLFVVHNTAADSLSEAIIGPDINSFLGGASDIHYLMDLNGHVIKFMKDHTKVNHAGGKWKGTSPNENSIGIEIVHKEKGDHEYTDDQYSSLVEFLDRINHAYPFDRTQITGHSDVGTHISKTVGKPPDHLDLDLLDGHRDQDPGQIFRWENLEQHNWGMIPRDVALGDAYGKLFTLAEDVVLQTRETEKNPNDPKLRDNDAKHRFGGKIRPGTPGTPITDLQNDLAQIGYSLHVNGDYDKYTKLAVAAFQRHFFSGTRRRTADGKVDKDTAQMIKNVLNGL